MKLGFLLEQHLPSAKPETKRFSVRGIELISAILDDYKNFKNVKRCIGMACDKLSKQGIGIMHESYGQHIG